MKKAQNACLIRERPFHYLGGGGAGKLFEKMWHYFKMKKIIWPSLYIEKNLLALICCTKKKSGLNPEIKKKPHLNSKN